MPGSGHRIATTPVYSGQPRLTEVAAQSLDSLQVLSSQLVKDAEGTTTCGREVLDTMRWQCYVLPSCIPRLLFAAHTGKNDWKKIEKKENWLLM